MIRRKGMTSPGPEKNYQRLIRTAIENTDTARAASAAREAFDVAE